MDTLEADASSNLRMSCTRLALMLRLSPLHSSGAGKLEPPAEHQPSPKLVATEHTSRYHQHNTTSTANMDAAIDLSDASKALDLANIRFQLM